MTDYSENSSKCRDKTILKFHNHKHKHSKHDQVLEKKKIPIINSQGWEEAWLQKEENARERVNRGSRVKAGGKTGSHQTDSKSCSWMHAHCQQSPLAGELRWQEWEHQNLYPAMNPLCLPDMV